MTIDRISHIEPLQPGKKPGKVESAQNADRFDSINLSPEALVKAEKYQVVELIKATQELDETEIVKLREQINDPSYINEKVIGATADKIVDAWLL
jgi:negative regulator of flagellin synthesis FlgM